jgi:divalent metal cation (Fe/Co/Zn/Cd) transporter
MLKNGKYGLFVMMACISYLSFFLSFQGYGFRFQGLNTRGLIKNNLYHHAKKYNLRSSLQMHMGHDHSHHQHESEPISIRSISKRPESKVILVAALALLANTLYRKRISQIEVIIFSSFATVLTLFAGVKNIIKGSIKRLQLFKGAVARHSSPINTNYLFKNKNAADRVTLLGVAINILLSVTKFWGGITFNSAVLVADAGHSLSDLLSDFITLWAVQVARLPADKDHPYGHGKFESVGSLFLSLTLLATGFGVGTWSYEKMMLVIASGGGFMGTAPAGVSAVAQVSSLIASSASTAVNMVHSVGHGAGAAMSKGTQIALAEPTPGALLLAALSIVSKEWLFRVTKKVGEALNSQILIANAWHHRSDSFSSVLSLFSIAAAIYLPGALMVDSAAGILIAGMISCTGMEVLFESVKQLTDSSDEVLADRLHVRAKAIEGVRGVKNIRARRVGSDHIADLTVLIDAKLSASAAHAVGERVRWTMMETFPTVLDAMVRTQAADLVCPLLSATQQRAPLEVENDVRRLLLQRGTLPAEGPTEGEAQVTKHPLAAIKAVPRVTVYYVDSAMVSVDVLITLDSSLSVTQAKEIAKEARSHILRSSKDIQQANISLDLTEIETTVSKAPPPSKSFKLSDVYWKSRAEL